MAKPFSKLRAKMSPAARRRSAARARKLIAAMPLHEPSQAMQISHDQLARRLRATQTNGSKVKSRTATRK